MHRTSSSQYSLRIWYKLGCPHQPILHPPICGPGAQLRKEAWHTSYTGSRQRNSSKTIQECSRTSSEEEVTAADLFCDQLKNDIKKTVDTEIQQTVVDKIVTQFNLKFHLILDYNGIFSRERYTLSHSCFISDQAKTYAFSWITIYTNEKLFKEPSLWYQQFAQRSLAHVRACIEKSVKEATKLTIAGQKCQQNPNATVDRAFLYLSGRRGDWLACEPSILHTHV